jgi:hypothetical protein
VCYSLHSSPPCCLAVCVGANSNRWPNRSASFATTTSRPIAKRADAPTAGAFMMKALYNTRFLMQTSTYYIFAFWQHLLPPLCPNIYFLALTAPFSH